MRKRTRKHKSKIIERLENTSPEEMARRWVEMRPRYLRFLACFLACAVILFLSNHVFHYSQGILNVINVAFQIACVFTALFTMLTAMSFIFGRTPAGQTVR